MAFTPEDLGTVWTLHLIGENLDANEPDAILFKAMMIAAFNQHAHDLNVDPWVADKPMAEVLQNVEAMIDITQANPEQSPWRDVIHTLAELYRNHLRDELARDEEADAPLPGAFAFGAGVVAPELPLIIVGEPEEANDSDSLSVYSVLR